MSAGELRERLIFQVQDKVESDLGTTLSDWEDEFTVAARIQPLRGSEPVIAQRLVGVQPVVIRVRSSRDTRRITSGWRAKNAREENAEAEYVVYNIRTVTPDERRSYIDMIAERGTA